jgi:hypothetical protein
MAAVENSVAPGFREFMALGSTKPPAPPRKSEGVDGAFDRNLYLKKHLQSLFDGDFDLQTSLWIIQ